MFYAQAPDGILKPTTKYHPSTAAEAVHGKIFLPAGAHFDRFRSLWSRDRGSRWQASPRYSPAPPVFSLRSAAPPNISTLAPSYSARRTVIGSIREARQAGWRLAATATAIKTIAAIAMTNGSIEDVQ